MGKKKNNKTKGDVVWDSGFEVVKPKIMIPRECMDVMAEIQDHVDDKEFSVLFRGKWGQYGFQLETDYLIPKQEVMRCSVDYRENIGELRLKGGWNVVVHSHPFDNSGSGSFSSSDEEAINSHFDCSLLYVPHAIADARLLVSVGGIKLQLNLDKTSITVWNINSQEIKGLNNIKEKTYGVIKNADGSHDNTLWGDWGGGYRGGFTPSKEDSQMGSEKADIHRTKWYKGRWYTKYEFNLITKQSKGKLYLFRGQHYTEAEWERETRRYLTEAYPDNPA